MLARSCFHKKTSLKAALLDQRVVAGLGNIYVCEALFRAHLSPRRSAATSRLKSRADRSRGATGERHPRGAQPGDQGRRLVAARPSQTSATRHIFSHFISGVHREGENVKPPL